MLWGIIFIIVAWHPVKMNRLDIPIAIVPMTVPTRPTRRGFAQRNIRSIRFVLLNLL